MNTKNLNKIFYIFVIFCTLQSNAQELDCNKIDREILNTISKLSIDKKWENAEKNEENMSILLELMEKEKQEKEKLAHKLWKKGKKQEAMCVLTSIPNYIFLNIN